MGECRRPRLSESAANIATHGIGVALALVGAPFLVWLADRVGTAETVAACAVYGLSLIAAFAASTRYHCRQGKPGDQFWLVLDHICIFLLIAGTATAMSVVAIRGDDRWYLLGGIWALAAGGIAFKLVFGLRWERASIGFLIALGWAASFTVPALIPRFPGDALAYLVGGGAAYSLGLLYYARIGCGRIPYSHAVWHLMALVGTGLFYFAVWEFLAAGHGA